MRETVVRTAPPRWPASLGPRSLRLSRSAQPRLPRMPAGWVTAKLNGHVLRDRRTAMSIAAQASGHGDVAPLRRSLVRGGHAVGVRETPRPAVFSTGDRACRLRKPVRLNCAGRSAPTL